jgi:DNA-binding transcriptional ArsR family regulator
VQRLAQGPATAGQLAALYSISRPAVSRHLRVLRDAGIVAAIPHGRHLWYEADKDGLEQALGWLRDVTKRIADAPRLTIKEPE